ncbi:MAG: enoyl-CoA hydratase/isomerase family protein, partial [Chloroflexi bacterium]|nr:enoyl-CoA hydratase/isomerase family protein [Chloroflexota bacterium]
AGRKDLAGLVIRSGKPGAFIVGADIREFVASIDAPKDQIVEMCNHGRQLFARLSQLPFVTVTAIVGQCVGGGAEMALWCDRRVMASDTKPMFGFPEVKLGLLPGWGGTVRSARVLGLSNAIELVTSGESIDAAAAQAMGLICDLVPSERLLKAAIGVIRAEQRRLIRSPDALPHVV